MEKGEYLLTFGEEEKVQINLLSSFFYYFRVIYAVSSQRFGKIGIRSEDISLPDLAKEIKVLLANMNYSSRNKYFWRNLGESELYITKIKKGSPLEITVVASFAALVVAVIVSGGEVDLSDFKFKLNPIGEGIAAIRKAMKGD